MLGKLVALCLFLTLIAGSVSAQTAQEFCDTIAVNAHDMFNDVNSPQFADGRVTYDDLVTHYAGAKSQIGFDLILMQRQILDEVVKHRGTVTAEDVNNYIYDRCQSDYNSHMAHKR